MRRRDFLAASAATLGLVNAQSTRAAGDESGRQLFEIRTYHFAGSEKQKAFEEFLAEAAVPAFNRAGIEPVGIFKLLAADNPELHLSGDSTDLIVLLPHNSTESVLMLESRLAADAQFQKAGTSVLHAPKSNPAYTRYDSTLLLAMEGAPRIQVPTKSPTRILQLRTYESHTQERAQNKLKMFNEGEFGIFKTAGMPGVFFGGAIVGANLPQLTYMVVHENMEQVSKNWSSFFAAPQWKTLSGDPSYKDNVSKVINLLLRPCEGSQV